VVPELVAIDLMVASDRGLPWRGELAWAVDSMAPAVLLMAPFLAGVGAWQALQDRRTDRAGLLRACPFGVRHGWLRIATAALVGVAVHAAVLAGITLVSRHTAQIGGWPVGAAAVQLAAIPAFVALGAAVGAVVDHSLAVLMAALLALGLGYADLLTRLPLGFLGDGTTGTLLGYGQSGLGVAGRLTWCAGGTIGAGLVGSRGFARSPRWVLALGVVVVLLTTGACATAARPTIWNLRPGTQTATRCQGELPRTCVVPAYGFLLPRTSRLVTRTASLLASARARGGPTTYVGWWPAATPSAATVTVISPGRAAEPAAADLVAGDVVAPRSCPQWRTGQDLDAANAAQRLVLAWLAAQDPELGPAAGAESSDDDLIAFRKLPAAAQRDWVGSAATRLATCRFAELVAPGRP
jgi:hypothetical protein